MGHSGGGDGRGGGRGGGGHGGGGGGGRGGDRGRGRGSAGAPLGPDDATLIKQRNKIEKQLAEITGLEKKRSSGTSLEPNQLAKMQRRGELDESLRSVYMHGTAEQRERLGICGNCGRSGHQQGNCEQLDGPNPRFLVSRSNSSERLLAIARPAPEDRGAEAGCWKSACPVAGRRQQGTRQERIWRSRWSRR